MDTQISRRDALRGFGGLCAAGVLGGGLAACGSGSGGSSGSSVTVWNDHPELKAGYEALNDAFMAAHPDIDVAISYKPAAEFATPLKTALVGGTAPDVFAVNASRIRGDTGVAGGYLAMLDDQVDPAEMVEAVRPVIGFDGHTWALPLQMTRMAFYYHKPIFEQHGLAVPTSWAELREVAEALQEEGIAAFSMPAQDMIIPYFFFELAANTALGADGFEALRSGDAAATTPALVEAATLMADLAPFYNKGFQGVPLLESVGLFGTGKAAMMINGTSQYVAYKEVNPEADLGFFGFPTPDGAGDPRALSGLSVGYVVNKKAKNLAGAREFIAWAAGEEAQRVVLERLGPPGRDGIAPTGSDPRSAFLREALAVEQAPFWLDYAETAGAFDAVTRSGSGLFTGDLSPEQFAQLVERAIVPSTR